MVDIYTNMKPDSFRLQVQTVLTAYYEDIKGISGHKRLPKDKGYRQTQVRGPRGYRDKQDAAADAAADAATPATPLHGGAAAAAGRVEPPPAPSTASSPAPSPQPWGQGRCEQAGGRGW